jgi:hypothetical protein
MSLTDNNNNSLPSTLNTIDLTTNNLIKVLRVGASDAHSICEISDEGQTRPYAKQFIINLFSKLECYITKKPVDCTDNEHTLRGKNFEPKILELYKSKHPLYDVTPQGTYTYERDDLDVKSLIIARTDGVVKRKSGRGHEFPLEIKCPVRQYESMPVKYYVQLQVQMLMMGEHVKFGHFLSVPVKEPTEAEDEPELDVENSMFLHVDRDNQLMDEILRRIKFVYGNYVFTNIHFGDFSEGKNDISDIPDVLFENYTIDRSNIRPLKL